MVYKNGGDGGGDVGDAPLLVWWVWCYLVYWFPDLNLVKNSVGTQKSNLVQFKSNNLLIELQVGFVPSLNKAQAVVTGSHNI